MSSIKAGVICTTKFIPEGSNYFTGFIDYIKRDSAVRNEHYDKFNAFQDDVAFADYQEYMGNPEKSSGLFTAQKDHVTDQDKEKLYEDFQTAQKNHGVMWQTVFSFDMEWLEKNGLYDPESKVLNEHKIMELTRNAMANMTEKEQMQESAVWCASVHYNTAHIHVHVAMTEPYPTRPKVEYNGKVQYRGKFKQSTFESTKSKIVNQVIRESSDNIRINNLIRDVILGGKKKRVVMQDNDLENLAQKLYADLKIPSKKWHYNSPEMKPYRAQIDQITKAYLDQYHKGDMETLRELLQKQEKIYLEAYGKRKDPLAPNQFAENKIQDLYTRMGNAILSELREHDKTVRKEYYRHLKQNQGQKGHGKNGQTAEHRPPGNTVNNERFPLSKKHLSFSQWKKKSRFPNGKLIAALRRTMNDAMREHMKNMAAYERMQRDEIEQL